MKGDTLSIKGPKDCSKKFGLSLSEIAIPRYQWYRAQKPLKPGKIKKIRKNYEIPHPGRAPKIRKKYRKNTKTAQKSPFAYFFWIFFSYFRGPSRGGGFRNFFVFFFVFPGLRGL